jgi:O-methyltransferase
MIDALKESLKRILPERVLDSLRHLRWPDSYLAVSGPPSFNADGLASWHNFEFADDPKFRAAYASGERTGSWKGSDIRWRAHVACWAAANAARLDGDFVECGVNRGGLSRTVIEYVDWRALGRTFWLLDTFRGLSERYISGEERARGISETMDGYYQECYDDVVATFRDWPRVKIVRGTVPDTLPQVTADKVAYLSIDMNCVEPEIAAIEYFWDKLVRGAVVVLDDYGWAHHLLQKRAFDEFARKKGVPILSMPTGQGLIVKV